MHTRKKEPCNGCNEYVTSDHVMFTGADDNCAGVNKRTRLTDIINKLIAFVKKRIARVRSTSLEVINDNTNCERGIKIELIPSSQPGNNLRIGSDGRPYVGPLAIDKTDIENQTLVFKKPIAFEDQVSAEDIVASGGIEAAFFKVQREGLQTIVPIFRGVYSPGEVYYFNDFVSYQGKLWYYHNEQQTSNIVPIAGPYWTVIVDRGEAGADGAPGVVPDYAEFRFAKNTSATTPPTLDNADPNPTGWTKQVPTVSSSEFIWMTIAVKVGATGALVGTWSIPIQTRGIKGADGATGAPGATGGTGPVGPQGPPGSDGHGEPGTDGEPGVGVELRFAKNGSATSPPAIDRTQTNPTGWQEDPPSLGNLEYGWMIKATKKNGVLQGQWSFPVRFSGMRGADGGGNSPFQRSVFIRSATTPATPTGGSYTTLPAGWTDGVPAGTDPIWMSTRIFTLDGLDPQQASWTLPRQLSTSSSLEVMWSIDGVLINPGTPATIPANWTSAAHINSVFRAERTLNGGIPGSWSVSRVRGEDGQGGGGSGNSAFKSFVFLRTTNTTQPSTPSGGSFASPIPTVGGWTDGVPAGTGIVWMSSRVFTSDGSAPQQSSWTEPRQMTSTVDFKVQFSHTVSSPGTPTSAPSNWHETGDENDIWMATAIVKDGITGPWSVVKIKGEDGEDGSGSGLIPKMPFRSYVYLRSNPTPSTPTGGTYGNPVPPTGGWTDGVPVGSSTLWEATRIFTEQGQSPQEPVWTAPKRMVDTATFFIRWSAATSAPGTPDTLPGSWTTAAADTSVWKATRSIKNGVSTPWNVVKIKGETTGLGDQGWMGPSGTFGAYRGIYDPFKEYYGSADKVEIVQYPDQFGAYYVSRADAGGEIPLGTLPTNTAYWTVMANEFETVATGLLLAKMAVIKNLAVSYLRTGAPGLGVAGTEHIEIYPSYDTLLDYRGQGDEGFAGLGNTDLQNLANTMIFYSKDDTGDRDIASVESKQLLKIQAIGDIVIPAVPDRVIDGVTIPGSPAVTIPGGSTVFQKTGTKTSNLSASNLLIKDGSTNLVYINGVTNNIQGATRFGGDVYLDKDVYIGGSIIESNRQVGNILVSGKWLAFYPPLANARTSVVLRGLDQTGMIRGKVTIINNNSSPTPLLITLTGGGGTGLNQIYRTNGTSVQSFTLASNRAVELVPGPLGDWFEL